MNARIHLNHLAFWLLLVCLDSRVASAQEKLDPQKSAAQVQVGVYCDVGAGPCHKELLKALEKFENV